MTSAEQGTVWARFPGLAEGRTAPALKGACPLPALDRRREWVWRRRPGSSCREVHPAPEASPRVPPFSAGGREQGVIPPAAHLTFSPDGSVCHRPRQASEDGCATGGSSDRSSCPLAWSPRCYTWHVPWYSRMAEVTFQWQVQALQQGWASAGSAWPLRGQCRLGPAVSGGFQKESSGMWWSGEALLEVPVW